MSGMTWWKRIAAVVAAWIFAAGMEMSMADAPVAGRMQAESEDESWREPTSASGIAAGREIAASTNPLYTREDIPMPSNGLVGMEFVIEQSHGLSYFPYPKTSSSRWDWQRPIVYGNREDIFTPLIVNRWLISYLENSGAIAYLCRERDEQLNEVIADINASGDALSIEGTWSAYSGNTTDNKPYGGLSLRTTSVAAPAAPTARIVYPVTIPESGYYWVTIWYPTATNAAEDVAYIITDGAGYKHTFRINQARNQARWNHLTRLYFEAGERQPLLEIHNGTSAAEKAVMADAVRFGGGWGDSDFGGGISGVPRWQENSKCWLKYMGAPASVWDTTENDSQDYGVRSNYVNWQCPTSLFLRIHSNAMPNPNSASGTYGSYFGNTTEWTSRMQYIVDQTVNSIRTNWDSSWRRVNDNMGTNTYYTYQRMLLEVAFHDTLNPDVKYLMDPDFRHILARGIYEGTADCLSNRTAVYLPEPPLAPCVVTTEPGKVLAKWNPPTIGTAPTRYRIYYSPHPFCYQNNAVVDAPATSVQISNLPLDRITYFQFRAENAGGLSLPSETLAACPSGSGNRILIVNGYDRRDWYVQETDNTRNYVIQHAGAILAAAGIKRQDVTVDSASNEAVEGGKVALGDYEMVDWILGKQAKVMDRPAAHVLLDRAFSTAAQNAITTYLNHKGHLFVSGALAAWDQDNNGSTTDKEFMRTALQTAYASSDAATYQVQGAPASLFEGIALTFDDGTQGTYDVDQPDVIVPMGSALTGFHYAGSTKAAGVYSVGSDSKVIYLAFPFETILDPAQRTNVMTRVLEAMTTPQTSTGETGWLYY